MLQMCSKERILSNFNENGFAILPDVLSASLIDKINTAIEQDNLSGATFRRSNDLFAIRQFFKTMPAVLSILESSQFFELLGSYFGSEYYIVKSIYFDKPSASNWFVSYHQDLTISVNQRIQAEGFNSWTVKQDQFAVQPPLNILVDNFTVRVHLDETTKENGALKVIPGSHRKGVYRPELIDWSVETESDCEVARGGVMIMRPLLLHSSGRTTNNAGRRVIHIEFSRQTLPEPLEWSERIRPELI